MAPIVILSLSYNTSFICLKPLWISYCNRVGKILGDERRTKPACIFQPPLQPRRNSQDGGSRGTLERLRNYSPASRKQPIEETIVGPVTVIKYTHLRSTLALFTCAQTTPTHHHYHPCPPHLCLCTADKDFRAAQQCRHQNEKVYISTLSLSLAVVPAAFHMSLLIPWASPNPSAQSPGAQERFHSSLA